MNETRSMDGTGNNHANPNQGATNSPLRRESVPHYADGVSAPSGAKRPNPRVISNQLCFSEAEIVNQYSLSNFIWAWGQFLDHELDLSPTGNDTIPGSTAPFNDIDSEIRSFLSQGTGYQASLPTFRRSQVVPGTGTSEDNPREQINIQSSYIDGSNVYGATLYRSNNLRTFEGGKLISRNIDDEEFLPFNDQSEQPILVNLENDVGHIPRMVRGSAFVAGDIRANEHAILTGMHTLFVREHNRICDELRSGSSGLSDEELFQSARCRVIGIMQAITYEEFLPALLGRYGVGEYHGYNANVDSSISNVFATACYRLGHSMLPENITLINERGESDQVALRELFFNHRRFFNENTEQDGFFDRLLYGRPNEQLKLNDIFRGMFSTNMLQINPKITESVRSFLFHNGARRVIPRSKNMEFLDLAALNIERGREHGLPDYNTVRADFGLSQVTSFAEITSDLEVQANLTSLYTSVDNIDVWIGSLCEDHLPGASVGPTIAAVLRDQFTRLRDGDRFYYENDPNLSPEDVKKIRETRLSEVLKNNTSLTGIPLDVFTARLTPTNSTGAITFEEFNSQLAFSEYQSPGVRNNRRGGPEQLYVGVSDESKITVSDGNNYLHGLYNMEVDGFTFYHFLHNLRDIDLNDRALFPGEGTVVTFKDGQIQRLVAAGRSNSSTSRMDFQCLFW
jgi:peroxidase